MTQPTITYGHGFLEDCDDARLSTYQASETRVAMIDADATLSLLHGDIFQIEAIFDGGATDEYVIYYYPTAGSLAIDPTVYNKWMIRYKTSESANGAKAKCVIKFEDATTEVLLPGNYSTTWKVATGSIAKSGSNIQHFRFYADDDGTDGTFYVYYDFALLHKNTFTFPFFKVLGPNFPMKVAQIEIPGRDGDIIQRLGMKSPEIILTADMQHGEVWGSKTGAQADSTVQTYGEYLYYLLRENAPWQWLTSDMINCKVTPAPQGCGFRQRDDSNGVQRVCELKFLLYSLSSLGETTWDDPQWYGE